MEKWKRIFFRPAFQRSFSFMIFLFYFVVYFYLKSNCVFIFENEGNFGSNSFSFHIIAIFHDNITLLKKWNEFLVVFFLFFLEKKSPDRVRRSLSQPSSSDRNSLYIELVFVGDVKLFGKYKKNEVGWLFRHSLSFASISIDLLFFFYISFKKNQTLVTNRFIEIASIVNAVRGYNWRFFLSPLARHLLMHHFGCDQQCFLIFSLWSSTRR